MKQRRESVVDRRNQTKRTPNIRTWVFLCIIATAAVAGSPSRASADDAATLQALVERWVTFTWSPKNERFEMDRISDLYSADEDLLAFDLMSPAQTVIKGWRVYEPLWLPVMQAHSYWELTSYDDLRISASSDTAWTAFTFKSLVRHEDSGEPQEGEWHATLGWERNDQGAWQIVHEHISGPVRR